VSPGSTWEFDGLSREDLIAIILEQRQQIAELMSRVAELEQRACGGGEPFAFMGGGRRRSGKVSKPDDGGIGDQKRKKRDHPYFRRVDPSPTETVFHAAETCPDCGRTLSGGWVHRSREVIDLPLSPFCITQHLVYARRCGVCGKRVVPKVDLSEHVVGKHRVGIRLMSWIAYLHVSLRVPLRLIQRLLKSLFGLHLGLGELTELMHEVSMRGRLVKAQLVEAVRGSPYVHADETGWCENGVGGYLWSFSTPEARVYAFNHSRSGAVAEEHLGARFNNTLVSDFYVAYGRFACAHQRCWVHLLRDLHELKETFRLNETVLAWAESVEDVYRRAERYRQDCLAAISANREQTAHGLFARKRQRAAFEQELKELSEPYCRARAGSGPVTYPHSVLAERCVRFAQELFVFVEQPNTPSSNNPAETALRPAVIARKVSGGTRSAKGSDTKTILMSLLFSWQLQGLDPAKACADMLTANAA
jgi:transposase